MAIVLPQKQDNFNRLADQFNQMMQQKSQMLAQFKMQELMSHLKEQTDIRKAERAAPFYSQMLGEEQGKNAAFLNPQAQSQILKQHYGREGVPGMLQALGYNVGDPNQQAQYGPPQGNEAPQAPMAPYGDQQMQPRQDQGYQPAEPPSYGAQGMPYISPENASKMTKDDLLRLQPSIAAQKKISSQESEGTKNRAAKLDLFNREKDFKTEEDAEKEVLKAGEVSRGLSDKRRILMRMDEIIRSNAEKIPGALLANSPKTLRNIIIRDGDVNELNRLQNEFISTGVQSIGGLGKGTKHMAELLKGSKIDMALGVPAMVIGIQNSLEDIDAQQDIYDWMVHQKNPTTGKYGRDLGGRVMAYRRSLEAPLKYPELYTLGDRTRENGKEYELQMKKNKQAWVNVPWTEGR